ncbi:MAG: hypothetical protein A2142_04075 [candidate division Zixibacteria bacterium RBG_16_48_11]|nr:MAG: hypothetical protein A2142_04075 [candidate division Zixibacteria bacterium RBG_16_48_11]
MSERMTNTHPPASSRHRKYIRFEIKTKVRFQLVFHSNHQPPAASTKTFQGAMLNISQGGMLLLTSARLEPPDFLAISFEVPGLAGLSNVLGKVKRVEKDKRKYLVGIEFCEVADFYSSVSMQNCRHLPKNLESFGNKLKDFLLRQKLATLF